jgi:Xaa-Pro aminopeptidase
MYFTAQNIENRRSRLAQKWDAILNKDECVLIYSGKPVAKPQGLDQCYDFIAHPSYYWLTGRKRETEILLYNKDLGWIEFQKQISIEEAFWEGQRTDLLVEQDGKDISQFNVFLDAQKFSKIHELGESGKPILDASTALLKVHLDQTRRVKDAAEIELIRQASKVALKAYEAIEKFIKPGVREKDIRWVFETEMFNSGGDAVPYSTIVGSGRNSAVLHALPTDRIVKEGEIVLIDAGAAIHDYCVDITRTYASTTNIDSKAKALYQLVLKVQKHCVSILKPGVRWGDVHCTAAKMFTEGLLDFGILKGSLSDLVEREVISMFFPHGLGHLVGLGVRDTGQEEESYPRRFFGANVRVNLDFEPGHIITVEPGLYFIEAVLKKQANVELYKDCINWAELYHWIGLGGIRIEDNILLTVSGHHNLTESVKKIFPE